MAKAFEGVRILDFSQVLAGPFATAQMALQGAEVIKVEQPGKGDQGREMMAEGELRRKRMSPIFLSANAGKRSLSLDLKHPGAGEIARRLVARADVLVENFKAGTMARFGLGYGDVQALNPAIIYCSVTGYGQTGPKAGLAAYDGAIQAGSGMMAVSGHPETGPVRTGYMAVDSSTALTAAYAIASALYRRSVTGLGQHIDVSMFDSALTMMAPVVTKYLVAGVEPDLLGNLGPALAPSGNVFSCAEGHIQISAITDGQFEALCGVLGQAEIAQDPRYGSHDSRVEHAAELGPELSSLFTTETAAEWQRRLAGAMIPCSLVNSVAQAVGEAQLADRGVLLALGELEGLGREVTVVGAGFTTDTDSPGTDIQPPAIGQHTDAILGEIGFGAAEIAEFRENGAV